MVLKYECIVGKNSISISKMRDFRRMLESGMNEGESYNFGLAVLVWSEASSIVGHMRMRRNSARFFDAGVEAKKYYKQHMKQWEKESRLNKSKTEWLHQKQDAYSELQKFF